MDYMPKHDGRGLRVRVPPLLRVFNIIIKMATLAELCANVPAQMKREATQRELTRRMNEAYLRRMADLAEERNVYAQCRSIRPQKARFKNTASAEAAGRIGTHIKEVRTPGSRIVVVCKAKNQY